MAEVELKEGKNSKRIVLPIYVDGFGISKGAKPFEEDKEEHEEFW
ncbi:MAG: hypothetical protein Q8N63_05995 [Nanoarchaeota archaeon]|nr:hypothetical protein [Nanoarchaeota archaeon]